MVIESYSQECSKPKTINFTKYFHSQRRIQKAFQIWDGALCNSSLQMKRPLSFSLIIDYIVAIVTKIFNLDERACCICHLRHLHYTNRLEFFEWTFCKLHYFTNIFASLFKPKLVLPPEVNIWEPKQDGER